MGRSGNRPANAQSAPKITQLPMDSSFRSGRRARAGAEGGRTSDPGVAVPKSHPASRPGFSPGRISRVGWSSTLEDSLGGQVSASNRPFHRGRPAGIGPVARQKQAVDRRALRGPKHSRLPAGRRTSPRARSRPTTAQACAARAAGQISASSAMTASRIATLSRPASRTRH